MRISLRLILTTVVLCATPLMADAHEDVSLQLKWKHAFQFAGYYMALEKGYYDQEGLSVTIIEGGPDRTPSKFVTFGPGRYAVSDSGILLAQSKGAKIKVLAAVFQHSPLALAVRKDSGIKSFADLRGRRVMMQRDEMDASILAAIYKSGLTEIDIIRQDTSFNLDDLIHGNTDAFSVYITDQPHQLKERGVAYHLLEPIQNDIDFYGDLLFTSANEADTHPHRVEAFKRASLKGWQYALENVDETIALIRNKYNTQNLSLRQLHFEAGKTADMILKDEIELGYISEFRWQQIARTYAKLGLVPARLDLTDFIYRPAPEFSDVVANYRWQLIISGLLILLAVFVIQAFVLRKLVNNRTSSLEESESLQRLVAKILEMIASGTESALIFEEIIQAFEQRYPGMRASILLHRDGRLYKAAAPSLPDEYNDAIEGIEIGPMIGSCGAATFLKKRVIVEDIATHPNWAAYTDLALPLNLRACWSEPVFDPHGEILGTFAMYYDHPRAPSEREIIDISNAARLTGIAIERDQRLAELRKLSRAVDQAGEVITITDRQGVIEYTNPAFSRITGYSAKEAIGKMPQILRDPKLYREVESTIARGKTWQGRVVETKKDGSTYPAMLTISPIRDEHGEITNFVGVHEDLSKMQLLEEQFHQAQKMEAIGTLVGGIAHDFNNMLAGMTGNLFLIRNKASGQPEIIDKVERIEKLSDRAADMIRQMLTFANKGIVERQNLSLTTFLKEAVKLHRASISENIRIDLDVVDDLHVFGDATQLHQALLNLMTNARDAVMERPNPQIAIKLERFIADAAFLEKHSETVHTHFAHLSVSDNGAGINPKLIQHIYDPFFTTKAVGKGTGLGLSMVFGSIQSHDGLIDVESTEDEGTTFHLYLPLIEPNQIQHVSSDISAISTGANETILLVDDDAILIEANREVIQSLGYKVITAQDGVEAVNIYRSRPTSIDLVILDLVMPNMGGKGAAAAIREINPDARIIFATGYDLDDTLGIDEPDQDLIVLSKPFPIQTLSNAIHQALNR